MSEDHAPITETTPRLDAACAELLGPARRIASYAVAMQPPPFREAIQRAIDADEAAPTVQFDLPTLGVRVLVDGAHWLAPRCLLALERKADG